MGIKQQTHKLKLSDTLANIEQISIGSKTAEERLFRIRRFLKVLANNFPDVKIGVMNPTMQFVPLDGSEFIGAGSISENHPHLEKHVLIKIKKAFSGKSVHCEVSTKEKFYEITAVPLAHTDTHVDEILIVMQNLTERKRMEEGLLKALEREKELGELKSRFVTMASHEFRTPLTSILASTFLLENISGSDYEKDKLVHTNRIKRSINNLTNILNEFLSLQKLEENKVSVVRTNINIPEFIQDDLIGEMDVVKKVGQTIEYAHSGNHTMAYLDHHILWSIITNLLSNSLKYSKVDDKIQITSELMENTFNLTVKDHGIGIPEDEQKYIFGRFYRARNALNIEGTGLGLHIVQKYVHLLNGTISFESQLNKGTNFTVVLPISQSDAKDPLENILNNRT